MVWVWRERRCVLCIVHGGPCGDDGVEGGFDGRRERVIDANRACRLQSTVKYPVYMENRLLSVGAHRAAETEAGPLPSLCARRSSPDANLCVTERSSHYSMCV